MMPKVLVAYATKYGSTREVAEAVAAELRERGLEADVRSAGEAGDLDGYSAVVLGVALYMWRLHADARRFLRRNRKALTALPVAVFGMGPFEDKPEDLASARETVDKALAKRPWFVPVAVTVFGGKFDPDALRFPYNNPGLKAMPASDARDWDAIKAWADTLPGAFGVGVSADG
jgi:menaquinone-dependent protoporphyrinogen oxidase